MFKNCVLKTDVNTVNWLKAAGIRAVKTMAQTAIPLIPVGAAVTEVDWRMVVGVVIGAGILSVITSIAGLPEVGKGECEYGKKNN